MDRRQMQSCTSGVLTVGFLPSLRTVFLRKTPWTVTAPGYRCTASSSDSAELHTHRFNWHMGHATLFKKTHINVYIIREHILKATPQSYDVKKVRVFERKRKQMSKLWKPEKVILTNIFLKGVVCPKINSVIICSTSCHSCIY